MRTILSHILIPALFLPAQTAYNVSLYGHLNKYGAVPNAGNYSEVWGWTDTVKHREYAFIGSPEGTSIIDITEQPIKEAAFIIGPVTNNTYKYHEFRTYKNYLYIGSEGTDIDRFAGIQIIDLSTLPDSASRKNVFVWTDTVNAVTGSIKKYYRSHTLSIDRHFLYANGGDFGGSRIMDLSDPIHPVQVGSYGKGSTPYVHDAFVTNDTLYAAAVYAGRVDIVNMKNKGAVTETSADHLISKTSVIPEGWAHQPWLSDDHRTMFVCTETSGGRVHVYDITDPSTVTEKGSWSSDASKSSHNSFVKGKFLYVAYYSDGLRVLDISVNPPIEVAFYKTSTLSSPPLFSGAWGVYPYFPSGKIAVSDMNNGLYVFTVNEKKGGTVTGTVKDSTNQSAIADAVVTVVETGRSVRTTAAGSFSISMAEGAHTLSVSRSGYVTTTMPVNTAPGTNTPVTIALTAGSTTIVAEKEKVPLTTSLGMNFPNPFNPSTTVPFTLRSAGPVTLTIFDGLGRTIATVVRQDLPAGSYSVPFNAASLSSGVYFYRLTAGPFSSTHRMILTR